MLKRELPHWVTALLVLALGLFASEARAGWLGAGCWVCESIGLTGPNAYCDMVGNGETGDGTNCYSDNLAGEYCQVNGVSCYNTVVDGGGGGGGTGGGGGGGSCTIGPSAVCPAQCMSCDRRSY